MDRREKAENDYRQKFDEFGLSDLFEFLGRDWSSDHGRKVFVKCKSCEAEFLTYAPLMIFKKRQDHLICQECGAASDGADIWIRSSECDEIAEYYAQGHSVKETAEKFNVTEAQINNLAKKRKISNGKDWREAGSQAGNNKQKAEAIQRLSKHLNEIGFDYVDGYIDSHGKATVRCRACGSEFERSIDYLKDDNVSCPECRKRESLARQEEKKRIAKQNADVKQVERLWYKLTHPPKDPYDEQHEAFLNRSGICEICGKPYTVREYVESCGLKKAQDNGVCSDICRQKKLKASIKASHKGRRDSHRHRAVKFGCEFDSSITLEKLIKRKGLRCAICGGMCDLNDHSWSEYSGPMYPSIDHIIPMSKGGGHTWDNVQIAHIICNSYKSDKVVGE